MFSALKSGPNIGSIRDSFLLNQLINGGYKVFYPKIGDFFVDENIIEVGGKLKSGKQIAGLGKAYIASDDILAGAGKKKVNSGFLVFFIGGTFIC